MPEIHVKDQFFSDGSPMDGFMPSLAELDGFRLLTFQPIHGSDFYGDVHYSVGTEKPDVWSAPRAVEAFRRQTCGTPDITEAVVDVRSIALRKSRRILAVGSSSFYTPRGCAFWNHSINRNSLPKQRAIYSFFNPESREWSHRGTIESVECGECGDLRVACAQMAEMADGTLVIPAYFATSEMIEFSGVQWPRQAVKTLLAKVPGDRLEVMAWSNTLTLGVKRGLLEPSVKQFNGKWFMTLRAEDSHAYVTTSPDALNWENIVPWRWDDGEVLVTDSTQQHFIVLGDQLYLCYTRKDAANGMVPRFRAPLFIARVNEADLTLERRSEQIVFPLVFKDSIPNMQGNFHCIELGRNSAAVADAALYITPRTEDKPAKYRSQLQTAYLFAGEQVLQN